MHPIKVVSWHPNVWVTGYLWNDFESYVKQGIFDTYTNLPDDVIKIITKLKAAYDNNIIL